MIKIDFYKIQDSLRDDFHWESFRPSIVKILNTKKDWWHLSRLAKQYLKYYYFYKSEELIEKEMVDQIVGEILQLGFL